MKSMTIMAMTFMSVAAVPMAKEAHLENLVSTLFNGPKASEHNRFRRAEDELDMCSYRMQNITRLADVAGAVFVSIFPIINFFFLNFWENQLIIIYFRCRSTTHHFTENLEITFHLLTWNSLVFIDTNSRQHRILFYFNLTLQWKSSTFMITSISWSKANIKATGKISWSDFQPALESFYHCLNRT